MSASIFQQLYTYFAILNILLAATVVFIERRNVGATWAWVMVLFFLPIVGFILYLFMGQNLSRKRRYRLKRDLLQVDKQALQQQHHQLQNRRMILQDPVMHDYQDLMYLNLVGNNALVSQDNEVEIYTDGNQKFEALFQDIKQAKDHVHLVYFIVRDDDLGNRLMNLLTLKVKEGIMVRFLVDAVGSRRLPKRFFAALQAAGGHVARFYSSRIPYINFRMNYRNHRKLAIIDGTVGYIGGFNIGDEYLGLSLRFGHWRDTHLRVHGSSVQVMQKQFLLDWQSASGKEVPAQGRYVPEIVSNGQIAMQIVNSGPSTIQQQIKNGMLKMIYAAKSSIYLQTPYFVPDESVFIALRMAAMSGIDVRMMIPSKPDHRIVYWATYSYLRDMLEDGVKCFLYEKGFLHAKMLVVDEQIATVGTTNMDIRSFALNYEINAFLYDTECVGRLRDIFLEDMGECQELTLERYRNRGWPSRIREPIARLLSPIL